MGDWTTLDEADQAVEAFQFESWDQTRAFIDDMSIFVEEWQGIPVPLGDESPITLRPGHPLRGIYEHRCSVEDVREDERVVNHWIDRRRGREVWVLDHGGKREALAAPLSPDRSMERLTLWMTTLGASDAWSLDAEHKAREHLQGMLSDRQWRHYDLTGTFLETSPRSRLTYVFRRLRPTLALSPRGLDGDESTMRCIAVLCMHPIGYYSTSWAGCMVPSDDVVAALSMMRGDEAYYWRKAVQHQPWEPEAGI